MRNALLRSFALRAKGLAICVFVSLLLTSAVMAQNPNHHRYDSGNSA